MLDAVVEQNALLAKQLAAIETLAKAAQDKR
jgi:hypothetical protein